MRFSSIPSLENTFRQTGNQHEYVLQPVAIPVPGEALTLNTVLATPKHRSGYFHDVAHLKQRIVLHFTAGNLSGDMSTLTRQDFHVSVPFVIARDGTIYQLYASKFWSGNLGKGVGNDGTGNAQDKATIGIEISNYGFLTERQGNLETIYSRQPNAQGQPGPADVYCALQDRAAYQKLDVPFRGERHFATFTDAQYESLTILLRYLTAQFQIPRQFFPEPVRYQTTNSVLTFRSIVSHVNYRPSGKWDIGSAFDWNRLINGMQAPDFQLTAAREVNFDAAESSALITSEEALIPLLPQAKDATLEDEPYDDAGEPSAASAPKPTLFALVVGINGYRADLLLDPGVFFPKLHGCVDDAHKVAAYLSSQSGFDIQLVQLTDAQATKGEIARQFADHLGQAGPDDVALFYFSGHGTQEYADPVWDEETDGLLECLACYYDEQTVTDFLLSDKELRYLIGGVYKDTNPHIVTIFDCCHSGDNTRAANVAAVMFADQQPVEKRVLRRGGTLGFPTRPWSGFVFANAISYEQVQAKKTAGTLPEGIHVQLAACEPNESAMEVAGEGVFTKALLTILDSTAGKLTYNDLQSRVRAYLRSVYEQQPRFRMGGGSKTLLYRTFLNQSAQPGTALTGTISHNKAGWTLNKGAIQGMSAAQETIVGIANSGVVSFRVGPIMADYTRLIPDPTSAQPPQEDTDYKAHIPGLMAQTIRVGFALEDTSRQDRAELLGLVIGQTEGQIKLVDEADEVPAAATRKATNADITPEEKADYVVRARKGQYYLSYPISATDPDDGNAYRPLAMPIETGDPNATATLVSDLRHVSRWEYLRQLTNKNPINGLATNPLQIDIWRIRADGSEEKQVITDGKLPLAFEAMGEVWACPLRVSVTNTTERNLYVSALYLSMVFESYLSLLPSDVVTLEPGKTVSFNHENSPAIPFQMSTVTPLYNWPRRVEYVQFIASTELFDPLEMQLDALPNPPTLEGAKEMGSRGPGQIRSLPKPHGWRTQRIDLQWENPIYNHVAPATVQAMMNDPALMDFALGLYFENDTDNAPPAIRPKVFLRDMLANVPIGEKGFFGDLGLGLANKIARFRRNQRYNRAIHNNPAQFRIVSEGDSWFQHPLVSDTIDHLAASFPVYCVAAAGDTLRNMTKAIGTPPIEEYLDAINSHNPAVFVLSGGGNDILGEQFRDYVKAGVAAGSAPKAYLEDLIINDLDSLQTMYRKLFGTLQTAHPDLKILVHGYDYIIPLSVTDKGWLGRYMIEKGINDAATRKAIIRYILTEFDNRLVDVAGEFPAVSYIPTPGTVADNQWYDEIHPNGEGFGLVAEKFKKRIDELTKPTP